MALAAASPFASFDITDKSQIRDISPVLSEALYLELGLLGKGLNVEFDEPAQDTAFIWNEEALNARTATTAASATSTATTLSLTAGHGARFGIGDLIYDTAINSSEVLQVTDISTDSLTVVRTYNSTVAASIASGATLATFSARQEGSDIGSDKSVKPVVRENYTEILFAGDLLVSRTQRNRKMATIALDVSRQLANRAIELKFDLTRMALYGEKSSSAGSDTVYRTCGGMRSWIRDNSGITSSTSEALAWSVLNTHNKTAVDRGKYHDTLTVGTDLVGSLAAIDSSNRRMLESDTQAGYTIQQVRLAQGNVVNIVVDGRVKTGDAFLYSKEQVSLHPFAGSGMFVIAATDFVDGVKRRLGAEWTLRFRNPEVGVYLSNRT
jgi:uncharacterized protein YqkB